MNSICFSFALIFGFIATASFAQYKTIGPGSCGLGQTNCHTKENNWWKDDAHKATVDKFYDNPPAYEKIAKLYGIDPDNMLKGSQSCMACHGTVISGMEARTVEDGVSCENCHGPGSEYKEPHAEGDAKLGANRPGRIKAMQLGMVELKNFDNRASACVRCHYITEQKLLATGHPDGANFSYVTGIKKVGRHWKRQPGAEDLAKAPFEKAMAAKGPIAQIAKAELAALPATPPPAPKTETVSPPATQTEPQPTPIETAPVKTETVPPPTPPPQQPQPARAPASQPVLAPKTPVQPALLISEPPPPPMIEMTSPPMDSTAGLNLPPFPSISDTMSVQEILVILKRRLELLYQKAGEQSN